jgi:hypothetical protein
LRPAAAVAASGLGLEKKKKLETKMTKIQLSQVMKKKKKRKKRRSACCGKQGGETSQRKKGAGRERTHFVGVDGGQEVEKKEEDGQGRKEGDDVGVEKEDGEDKDKVQDCCCNDLPRTHCHWEASLVLSQSHSVACGASRGCCSPSINKLLRPLCSFFFFSFSFFSFV